MLPEDEPKPATITLPVPGIVCAEELAELVATFHAGLPEAIAGEVTKEYARELFRFSAAALAAEIQVSYKP
jgi:hypothetical protein